MWAQACVCVQLFVCERRRRRRRENSQSLAVNPEEVSLRNDFPWQSAHVSSCPCVCMRLQYSCLLVYHWYIHALKQRREVDDINKTGIPKAREEPSKTWRQHQESKAHPLFFRFQMPNQQKIIPYFNDGSLNCSSALIFLLRAACDACTFLKDVHASQKMSSFSHFASHSHWQGRGLFNLVIRFLFKSGICKSHYIYSDSEVYEKSEYLKYRKILTRLSWKSWKTSHFHRRKI